MMPYPRPESLPSVARTRVPQNIPLLNARSRTPVKCLDDLTPRATARLLTAARSGLPPPTHQFSTLPLRTHRGERTNGVQHAKLRTDPTDADPKAAIGKVH